MSRPDATWQARAACQGLADDRLDVWHHDGPTAERRAAEALAREVCATCPVRAECVDLGVALLPLFGAEVGTYGGLTHTELVAEARGRGLPAGKVAAHGTRSRYITGCRCTDCRHGNAAYQREQRTLRAAA